MNMSFGPARPGGAPLVTHGQRQQRVRADLHGIQLQGDILVGAQVDWPQPVGFGLAGIAGRGEPSWTVTIWLVFSGQKGDVALRGPLPAAS